MKLLRKLTSKYWMKNGSQQAIKLFSSSSRWSGWWWRYWKKFARDEEKDIKEAAEWSSNFVSYLNITMETNERVSEEWEGRNFALLVNQQAKCRCELFYYSPMLRVLVVLLSRFSDEMRVERVLVCVRERNKPNCWFPASLLLFMFVIDVDCVGCFESFILSPFGFHCVMLLPATLGVTFELSFMDDSDGTLPISISS